MKKWEKMPDYLRTNSVRPYYNILKKKWFFRFFKRLFDIFASVILMLILFIPSFIIGLLIVCTSRGGPFFCQERVGRYGKPFRILKFRTMKKNSEGDKQITSMNDSRITKIGTFLRKSHMDEFPQLLNVFVGQMSFVGTRPEVQKYVNFYNEEWNATFLMRPGITSTASFSYDDEAKYMSEDNAHEVYIKKVLPFKMNLNLEDLRKPSIFRDISILWKTLFRCK